jgi:hypothetical protein
MTHVFRTLVYKYKLFTIFKPIYAFAQITYHFAVCFDSVLNILTFDVSIEDDGQVDKTKQLLKS